MSGGQGEDGLSDVQDVSVKGETASASSASSKGGMTALAANSDRSRHPLIELLARYRQVFALAWAHRGELAGPRRHLDETAFLPAALSLQHTPVHPAPLRLTSAIMAFFVIALVWSVVGEIDIVAVAPGRIVVSERTKLIQPLERSVVKRVLVADGDHVLAGQALVELDPTATDADSASAQEMVHAAQSEFVRAKALQDALARVRAGAVVRFDPAAEDEIFPRDWSEGEVAAAKAQLLGEWADISAKLSKLSSEINRRQAEIGTARGMLAKYEATVPLARAREADFKKLVEQGFMSSHATQDKTRERIELEQDLATQRARLLEAEAALRESESARAAYQAEVRRTLYEREGQAQLRRVQASQERAKAVQRQNLTTLKAPVAGVVQQLAIHTPEGVVTEAQVLMVIVPDGAQVTAEVTLDNKDIGFVSAGQEAQIKLETFPFTRYGTVRGTVSRVTPDAVNDEKRGAIFPAVLKLGTESIDVDGRAIKLSPGMNLTAEIKTGKRRVIEYLLSPIQTASRQSMRER